MCDHANGTHSSCLQQGLAKELLICVLAVEVYNNDTLHTCPRTTALTPHPSPLHLPLTPLQCCLPFLPLPALVVPQALLAGKVLLGLARYMLCHFGLNHHSKEGVLCVCRFVWGACVCARMCECVCVYV